MAIFEQTLHMSCNTTESCCVYVLYVLYVRVLDDTETKCLRGVDRLRTIFISTILCSCGSGFPGHISGSRTGVIGGL